MGLLITALKPEKLNLGSRYKTLDIAENGMALEITSLCLDNPTSYFMKQRLQKTQTTTMVHKNNLVAASFRRPVSLLPSTQRDGSAHLP